MSSFKVITDNWSLLLFPVISTSALLVAMATFFGGGYLLFGSDIDAYMESGDITRLIPVFIFYLIDYFIIIFFNSALVYCASKALNQEPVSVGDGLRFAAGKINRIFMWSLASATAGTVLQVIRDQGKIGEIVSSLIGFAWTVMTFFVVPVLIFQDKGVVGSVKESTRLMKEKWGESIVGNTSFSLFYFLGALVAAGIGILIAQLSVLWGIAVGVFLFLLIAVFISAARTVFVAAVYNNVVGTPSTYFELDTLDGAFMAK